jgi:lycopene cyclase domain-containing protein
VSTYLLIDSIILFFPLILSFDRKVNFYTKWKFVFPAILLVAAAFIFWDSFFTGLGVWSFNPVHVGKIFIAGLPLEEILFFVVVPYASLFVYETLNAYYPKPSYKNLARVVSPFLILSLIGVGLLFINQIYTSITFISLAIVLILLTYFIKVSFLGRFYITYLIVIVPFTLFNGILTGTFLKEAVVIYNNAENLGIRLLTIPVEDIFYGMLLILLNVFFFELFRKRLHAE